MERQENPSVDRPYWNISPHLFQTLSAWEKKQKSASGKAEKTPPTGDRP